MYGDWTRSAPPSCGRHFVKMSTGVGPGGLAILQTAEDFPVCCQPARRKKRTAPTRKLWRIKCMTGLRFGFCADGACSSSQSRGSRTAEVLLTGEVRMQFIRCNSVKSGEDVISGILNCVCPECGGRMGERGKEFRCQGECLTDWRQAWEQASAELRPRSKRSVRQI